MVVANTLVWVITVISIQIIVAKLLLLLVLILLTLRGGWSNKRWVSTLISSRYFITSNGERFFFASTGFGHSWWYLGQWTMKQNITTNHDHSKQPAPTPNQKGKDIGATTVLSSLGASPDRCISPHWTTWAFLLLGPRTPFWCCPHTTNSTIDNGMVAIHRVLILGVLSILVACTNTCTNSSILEVLRLLVVFAERLPQSKLLQG